MVGRPIIRSTAKVGNIEIKVSQNTVNWKYSEYGHINAICSICFSLCVHCALDLQCAGLYRSHIDNILFSPNREYIVVFMNLCRWYCHFWNLIWILYCLTLFSLHSAWNLLYGHYSDVQAYIPFSKHSQKKTHRDVTFRGEIISALVYWGRCAQDWKGASWNSRVMSALSPCTRPLSQVPLGTGRPYFLIGLVLWLKLSVK